jgi:hypothetical protein
MILEKLPKKIQAGLQTQPTTKAARGKSVGKKSAKKPAKAKPARAKHSVKAAKAKRS